ncbi:MAG TPA: DUF1592 domain-containing protein, partial [Pirellulales bacterium]|nr:DUF1592 domain-containing protein [Pirellulales bacterium]
MRFYALAIAGIFSLPAAIAAADEPIGRQFFAAHCLDCHAADTQEGGLRLDTLAADFSSAASFELWVKVHDKLARGEMPPADSPQPPAEERRKLVQRIAAKLSSIDLARRQSQGRAPVRRLNRTEYEYTLRDLLDLPGLEVRELLPEDGRVDGYDKSGDGLELSHVQVAKYMEAADLARKLATVTHTAAPEIFNQRMYPSNCDTFRPVLGNGDAVFLKNFQVDESIIKVPGPIDKNQKERNVLKALPRDILEDYEVSVGVFRHEDDAFRAAFNGFETVSPGMYRLRISLWSFEWDQGRVLPAKKIHAASLMAVMFKEGGRVLGYFDAPSLKPAVHEMVVWLNPGERVGFNAASLPHVRVSEREGRAARWVGPGIAIDWLEIEGPLMDHWPMESHRRLYGDLTLAELPKNSTVQLPDHPLVRSPARKGPKYRKHQPWTVVSAQPREDAQRLLGAFLRRALRRPVAAAEIERYGAIVEQLLHENLTFEDALGWAYKTALCSPEFLFLAEPAGPLCDRALAARLSYFLWNSLPDNTLMALADAGKLHEPAVLREQVERMLGDAKSQRLVDDFVGQWLGLRDIDDTTPDKKLYPEFSVYLRDSMLGETRAFFRELLDHDQSVLEFVDSDFAMLNQRMAEHYGIAGVEGTRFRRVTLPEGCHRGGVMTQAAVLKITANGTTTTPVKRGSWVLREILGQPPSPPPPGITAIEPDVQGTTTIRAQLDKHRSLPVCASCHARMDPPGFALESFDVIGAWRARYRSLGRGDPVDVKLAKGNRVAYQLGPAVDPSGQLKDGRKFDDIDRFRQLLLADSDQIARNVIGQLLVYATGAPVSFADRAEVEEILNRARERQFGLRWLVHEVVQSRLFRE